MATDSGDGEPAWTVVYQQQSLRFADSSGPELRNALSMFFKELASGQRSGASAALAARIGNRALRRGTVFGRAVNGGECAAEDRQRTLASVLWTTDFRYDREAGMYEEVVQVWEVTDSNAEPAAIERLRDLWSKKSRRDEASLRQVIKRPRPQKRLEGGRWVEWPRRVPCEQRLDMAWLSRFMHLPEVVHDNWLHGRSIVWDRLPLIGTEEQQRHVLAPGPLLLVGRAGSGKTLVLRDRLWHHYVSFRQLECCDRQIFVTLSPELARSALEQFAEAQWNFFPDAHPAVGEEGIDFAAGVAGLPPVPIFLSFRSFLKILAPWLEVPFFNQRMAEADFEGTTHVKPGLGPRVEITFQGFVDWFWPGSGHKGHKGGLDPLLVWAEIQTLLKGDLTVASGHQGAGLTHQQYKVDASKRQAVGLDMTDRDKVFHVFEMYQGWCRVHKCFDRMDAAQSIAGALRTDDPPSPWIDWIYIDEVQDFAFVELEVMMRCLKDLRGFSCGGDTTQTVSQGIGFRFCDVDSLLLKEAERRTVPVPPPKRWAELTINHRSHMGLVDLSNVFVQLLETLFPWTVDKLAPARSSISGPRPLFLDLSNVPPLRLGADQVVLTNSPSARLPTGWSGLLATPAQVKGLEYTDVVLLDWWDGTPHRDLWEALLRDEDALLQLWADQGSGPGGEGGRRKLHNDWQSCSRMPLSKELKQLFVAVTRAQQSLVLCTHGAALAMKVRRFLVRLGVVDDVDQGTLWEVTARAGQQQTAGTFEARGDSYFRRRLFDFARQMFTSALESQNPPDPGLQEKVRACDGFLCIKAARAAEGAFRRDLWLQAAGHLQGLQAHRQQRSLCLEEAAEAETNVQMQSALWESAAASYEEDGQHEQAANCCERAQDYSRAGRLFEEAGLWQRSVECILLSTAGVEQRRGHFARCALSAAKGEGAVPAWAKAVAKDNSWWSEMVPVAQHCGDVLQEAEFLREAGEFVAAGNAFELVGNLEFAAECFEEVGTGEAGAHEHWLRGAGLFKNIKAWKKAAELFKRVGEHFKAAEMFQQGGFDKRAAELFNECFEFEHAARCYERASDFDAAIQVWKKRGCGHEVRRVQQEAAEVREKHGDWARAIEYWKTLRMHAREGAARMHLAEKLQDPEERQAAAAAWLRAADEEPAETATSSFLQALQALPKARMSQPKRSLVAHFGKRWHTEVELASGRGSAGVHRLFPALGLSGWLDSVGQDLAELLASSDDSEDRQLSLAMVEISEPNPSRLLGSGPRSNVPARWAWMSRLLGSLLTSDAAANCSGPSGEVPRSRLAWTIAKLEPRPTGNTPEKLSWNELCELVCRLEAQGINMKEIDECGLMKQLERARLGKDDLMMMVGTALQVAPLGPQSDDTLAQALHVVAWCLGLHEHQTRDVVAWQLLEQAASLVVGNWSRGQAIAAWLSKHEMRQEAHECLKGAVNIEKVNATVRIRSGVVLSYLKGDGLFGDVDKVLWTLGSNWATATQAACPQDWPVLLTLVAPFKPKVVSEHARNLYEDELAEAIDTLEQHPARSGRTPEPVPLRTLLGQLVGWIFLEKSVQAKLEELEKSNKPKREWGKCPFGREHAQALQVLGVGTLRGPLQTITDQLISGDNQVLMPGAALDSGQGSRPLYELMDMSAVLARVKKVVVDRSAPPLSVDEPPLAAAVLAARHCWALAGREKAAEEGDYDRALLRLCRDRSPRSSLATVDGAVASALEDSGNEREEKTLLSWKILDRLQRRVPELLVSEAVPEIRRCLEEAASDGRDQARQRDAALEENLQAAEQLAKEVEMLAKNLRQAAKQPAGVAGRHLALVQAWWRGHFDADMPRPALPQQLRQCVGQVVRIANTFRGVGYFKHVTFVASALGHLYTLLGEHSVGIDALALAKLLWEQCIDSLPDDCPVVPVAMNLRLQAAQKEAAVQRRWTLKAVVAMVERCHRREWAELARGLGSAAIEDESSNNGVWGAFANMERPSRDTMEALLKIARATADAGTRCALRQATALCELAITAREDMGGSVTGSCCFILLRWPGFRLPLPRAINVASFQDTMINELFSIRVMGRKLLNRRETILVKQKLLNLAEVKVTASDDEWGKAVRKLNQEMGEG